MNNESQFFTLFLAIAMIITGSMNILCTKFQDLLYVKGIGDTPPKSFEHPFFQAGVMFVGELLCLLVFCGTRIVALRNKKQQVQTDAQKIPHANPLLFWIPAMCDLGGTSLQYVALFLV